MGKAGSFGSRETGRESGGYVKTRESERLKRARRADMMLMDILRARYAPLRRRCANVMWFLVV